MAVEIRVEVNGRSCQSAVEPRLLLVHYLRDVLGLTGTHIGCETSLCGACTVLVNGQAVKSCTMLAVEADGGLHPVQEAFRQAHALQCGYCTPGMILTVVELLARRPDPSEAEIRRALAGNLCRCTGYQNIVAAVERAAAQLRRRRPRRR